MSIKLTGRWAVVTGASSGIGREIAKELGRLGCHLVLVARREQRLKDLADKLRDNHNNQVDVLAMDLTDEDADVRLSQHCIQRDVTIVVNNAGFGMTGLFEHNQPQQIRAMVQLNVVFMLSFTHRILPHLKQHHHPTRILNVGSVAGCQGVSYFAPYAATKALVNNFSQGLAWEQDSGQCRITCLQPSKTASEFFEGSGMTGSRFLSRNVMTAQDVARIGVAAMVKGKQRVVPGFINKLMVFSLRFSTPSMVKWVIRRLFRDLA